MRKICCIQLNTENLLAPDLDVESDILETMVWWSKDLNIKDVGKSMIYQITDFEFSTDSYHLSTKWFTNDQALQVMKEVNTAIIKLNEKKKENSIKDEQLTEIDRTASRLKLFSQKWNRYVITRFGSGGDYESNYQKGTK